MPVRVRILNLVVASTVIVLTACQTNYFPSDAADSSGELILNEADYNFVYKRMEDQIKIAPNNVHNIELGQYLSDLSCEVSAKYCSQIRIYVIQQPYFNAHMLPNGTLILFSGLLLRINSRQQLAYILAHEIAHYVHKHGLKKINYAKLISRAQKNIHNINPISGLNQLGRAFNQSRYSQALEREADDFSINTLINQKMSLADAAMLFENLKLENSASGKSNLGGFLSSHPGIQQRINLLNSRSDAVSINKFITQDSWQVIKNEFLDDWLTAELRKREYDSTRVLLKQLQSVSDKPGYFEFYFGEIYRKQGGIRNLQSAINHYQKHLETSNGSIVHRVYKNMAQAYANLDNFSIARRYYLKYLNLKPKPADLEIIKRELDRLPLRKN